MKILKYILLCLCVALSCETAMPQGKVTRHTTTKTTPKPPKSKTTTKKNRG